MSGHLTSEQQTALREGCVNEAERTSFETHLKDCEPCREEATHIRETRRRIVEHAAALGSPSIANEVMETIAERRRTGAAMVIELRPPNSLRTRFFGTWKLRFAALAVALLVVVSLVGVFLSAPSQAWTLDEGIKAVQGKRGIHLSGSLMMDGNHVDCEMWIRGRQGQPRIQDMVLRVRNGVIIWMNGNATYFYNPPESVVHTDDAQTAGLSHWPGPEFLELLRRIVRNAEIDYRFDLFSRRRVAVFKAQMIDVGGAKSFILEFDPTSKLLVSIKSWQNFDWSGAPAFSADSVEYLDSPPDSLFEVDLPTYVSYVERDVTVPTELIALLGARSFGLSEPGVSEAEASRKIVEQVYAAEISGDLEALKRLAPVTSLWDDKQVEAILGGVDGQEMVVELVEVGEARRRGRSPLGPLVVVPATVRHKDGALYEHKIIVQIRQGVGPEFSCVVFGPYGVPYPLD